MQHLFIAGDAKVDHAHAHESSTSHSAGGGLGGNPF
jgi:hypothetical protein